jgi:4-hydroxy-tetrahydrodipicolinate reductase
MGREVVKMLVEDEAFSFVRGVSRSQAGNDVGETIGLGPIGVTFSDSLETALLEDRPDVLVDFTVPEAVKRHTEMALELGVRPVVGTTGLTEQDLTELARLSEEHRVGAVIAPNFALGAVLMMMFAARAAKYFPHVEIIEMHHDQKLDAPSGTALKTAEMIAQNRDEVQQGHPGEKETLEGARGGYRYGFRIHSIRLPGLVAHQEVIFGGPGQTFTLRHDSIHRESFMPGVKLAIQKVMELDHLVYGLEHLLKE